MQFFSHRIKERVRLFSANSYSYCEGVTKRNVSCENISPAFFNSYFTSIEQWSWSNTTNGYEMIVVYIWDIEKFFMWQGWNSWNHFGCNINEKLIQQTADLMVSTGLAAAGYQYGWLCEYDFEIIFALFSKYGWLLASKSRCQWYDWSRSESVSEWHPSSRWLCAFA